jgi:glycosyltransferase involved in cell wall biosynthesis
MKIAIVVQGRFHAFDLANALLRRQHDVTVFTNYPRWAVKRFGFPEARVRSFWLHGAISKAAYRARDSVAMRPERLLNPLFGRWAARELARESWDVIHSWSGVSEEIHERCRGRSRLNLIMRGSAHVREQDRILRDEEQRTTSRLDRPDEWIQQREEREYQSADRIVVLSSFARDSFIAQGINPTKLRLLRLGTNTAMFRPTPETVDARCARILAGEPLRIIYVGALSLRKGLWDIERIVRQLQPEGFQFTFVGPVTAEAAEIVSRLHKFAEFVPKQPQHTLPGRYSEGDLFMFPTIEDGFAVVLAQAQANALPVLTTPNCSGPDLIREGDTGWVLPIRDAQAFIDRLRWCDANRPALADMVRRLYTSHQCRTWDDVASDFERFCIAELSLVGARRELVHA